MRFEGKTYVLRRVKDSVCTGCAFDKNNDCVLVGNYDAETACCWPEQMEYNIFIEAEHLPEDLFTI